jgi:AcrR family transcriptional regulator
VARPPRQPRLSREDWIRAALEAIAAGGIRTLAIERLARKLGATRGSFYWHFEGRADLVEAALATWERENTIDLLPDAEAIADPAERLRYVIGELYEKPVDAIELALAGTAGDPAVDQAVARVTRTRLHFLRRIFLEIGLAEDEATDRAWLTYGFYLGHHQLTTVPGLDDERPPHLTHVTDLLRAEPDTTRSAIRPAHSNSSHLGVESSSCRRPLGSS